MRRPLRLGSVASDPGRGDSHRHLLAKLPSRPVRAAVKIAVCTGVCLLLYGVVWRALGLPEAPAAGGFEMFLLALANATFLILDRALERLTALWRRRLRRRFLRP